MSEILDSAWEVEEELLERGAMIMEAAIRTEFRNGLPKMWEGKPFSALKLTFERDVARGSETIASESMEITPLLTEDAQSFLQDGELIKHYGVERLQTNQALAEAAGRILLNRDTDIADILKYAPVDMMFGWWPIRQEAQAEAKNPPQQRLGVYGGAEGAPDMRVLVSAKLFAEEIYDYARSPHFLLPLVEHLRLAAESGSVDESIYHYLQPAMTADLPLNGYEGPGFLRHYAGKMDESRNKALARLYQAQELPKNEFTQRLVERAEQDVAKYDEAIAKARRFLAVQ